LANLRIHAVKGPTILQRAGTQTLHISILEIGRDTLDQPNTMLSAVLAGWLELNQVGSDKPVAHDVVMVHSLDCAGLCLLVNLGKGLNEDVVVHSNELW
jgi:hypothetical protein